MSSGSKARRHRLRSLGLVLGSVLAVAGCGPKPESTKSPERPQAHAAPARPAAAEKTDAAPLPPGTPVSLDSELRRVQEVRELTAGAPVRGLRIAEADLLEHLKGSFAREVPPHALAGTEEMLRLLGVVPLDFDYEGTVLGLLKQQLAGLYDPRLNALFIRDHLEGAELEATLYHELVHALQDQTYHLDDFSAWKEDGTDRSSALSAVAEGDAMSAMYDSLFSLAAEQTGGAKRTALDLPTAQILVGFDAAADVAGDDGVPPIVRRSLIAPYRDGLLFVHALRRQGGWKLVNSAFEKPPASTEQVLHVERFLAREAPVLVDVVPPAGSGWQKVLSDVWGEQSVRLLFEEWQPRPEAATSAGGWGGDRIAVFSRGQERILTWHLVLDDEAAAARYLRAFAHDKAKPGDAYCTDRGALGPLVVVRRGAHLLALAGPRGAAAKGAPGRCDEGLAWARAELATSVR